jgi:predicted ATPase
MRIEHIKVDNFKSLVDFDLPLAKFNCLVGLNGAGKSTILQFFDFLSQQVKGDMNGWLEKRQWKSSDLNSKLTSKKNVDFEVILSNREASYSRYTDVEIICSDAEIKWIASFNRQTLRCTTEQLKWGENVILRVENGNYHIRDLDYELDLYTYRTRPAESTVPSFLPKSYELSGEITFDYQGSVISQISEHKLPYHLREIKRFFSDLHALDLLAPELLRQRTRDAGNSLGLGGEKLSAFLHEIGEEKRANIQQNLAKVYPQFKHLDSSALRSGWKSLTVHEQFGDLLVKTEARHVADGLLRMLAVFAQLSKEQSFLLLDEIENGVNPELIEFLVDQLVEAQPQVLITTHSPMVLNYMEDDIAIEGIIYIYKQPNGATKAIRLFDIPSMRKKLEVMGPGEVYEDTSLTKLYREISEIV